MVRHFYNRGEDAPLWVVFEILYLSDLACFFECLNEIMRERIMTQLNMFDVSLDTNRNLLSSMLYTIKSLRNSVAHNNIIFDTRFKDRKISPILKITLYSLIDYIIIVCCMLKRVDFSSTRAKLLVGAYKKHNQLLQNNVAPAIYAQIIQQNVSQKIAALEIYLNS